MLVVATLAAFLFLAQAGQALALAFEGFGKKVAGTYLSVEEKGADILQINSDGNLSFIFWMQFSGGVLNDLFSDTLGSWTRTGKRELTTETVDLTFEKDGGTFVGVGAVRHVITFDKKFQSAHVKCTGAIYGPGVNPFAPGAKPLPNSEILCGGGEGFLFQRVPEPKGKSFSIFSKPGIR